MPAERCAQNKKKHDRTKTVAMVSLARIWGSEKKESCELIKFIDVVVNKLMNVTPWRKVFYRTHKC